MAMSSQIGMLEALANALENCPSDRRGSWVRDVYKSNMRIFNQYFATMEQASAQSVEIQVNILRQSAATLRAVLSNMEPGSQTSHPDEDGT